MGDHRISLKAEFSMHGHTAKIDQWVNYSENYVEEIAEWLRTQIEIGMDRYLEVEHGADILRKSKVEAAERAELERLKAKYEPET